MFDKESIYEYLYTDKLVMTQASRTSVPAHELGGILRMPCSQSQPSSQRRLIEATGQDNDSIVPAVCRMIVYTCIPPPSDEYKAHTW